MINNELINPKSIVIVGASENPSKIGGKVLKNILSGNFKGDIFAINPKEETVQGINCHSLEDLPEVELAIIAVSVKYVKEYVTTLTEKKKTKAFIILSAGFGEMGEEGKILEQEIVDIVNKNNASLIGPNCIGVLNHTYNGIFAGPIPKLDPKGCDFVSGSGATAAFIIEKGMPMGLSFASLFSVGNSAQIGVEEVMKYWDENFDPETSSKVKLLYMENIDKPKMLLKHARSLIKKGCKIAAIKAGSSDAGSRAASSHTGALATPDKAVEALFKKAGIVRCYGREELIYTAAIFTQKELKGKNIAIITHAGGPGVMLTDALSQGGMFVPHIEGKYADELIEKLYPGSSVSNPIDFLATGNAEQLGIIIDYIDDKFDNIDGMVVIFGSPGLFEIYDVYELLNEKMKTTKKPIYPLLPSIVTTEKEIEYFKDFGRVYFSDEVNLGLALTSVSNSISEFSEVDSVNIDVERIRKVIDSSQDGYLQSNEIVSILDAAGIPRVPEYVSRDINSIIEKSNEFGYPIVMKIVGPVHKSDVGGIALNIMKEQEIRNEYLRMEQIEGFEGIMIQPMLSGSEFFAGVNYEDSFGHMILCGLGGIYIEVFKDTAQSLAPIYKDEALSMIRSLKSYKIIQGVRGKEGMNEDLFAEIITRLSKLVGVAPEIKELDLNPLLGTAKSVIAVDARIRVEK
jgi:acyl-CoA synthetase (NDP forming)